MGGRTLCRAQDLRGESRSVVPRITGRVTLSRAQIYGRGTLCRAPIFGTLMPRDPNPARPKGAQLLEA